MSEAIAGTAPVAAPRTRARVLALLGFAVFLVASVGLFVFSRGKWSDAIVDSGSEWIFPDALARGELLYRDVVYWFGPVTPYFHAAFFALFGSSFGTLVIAGLAGSIGALACLYLALVGVTGRRAAALWTALAVPVLVFMPNSGGSILGMGYRIWHPAAFALLAVSLGSRRSARRRKPASVGAGACAALAGLCRLELGIVAMAAVLSAQAARTRLRPPFFRQAGAAFATFLAIVGGTLAAFALAAGSKAVFGDGHLLLTNVPEETRTFLWNFSQVGQWPRGLLELGYSAAAWIGAVLLLQVAAIGKTDRVRIRRKLPLAGILTTILAACAALGGAGGAVGFSAAPLFCLLAVAAGLYSRTAPRPALVGFGVAGALFFHRRPFHIVDGAYVAPPLLFGFVCAAGLAQWLLDRETDERTRDRMQRFFSGALVLMIAFAFAVRVSQYRDDRRVAIPGTRGMLSAEPDQVAVLSEAAGLVRRASKPGEGLVVFPEGAVLNSLTDRTNPIRHKLYIPGYLTEDNEAEIIQELARSSPRVIVMLDRATSEYGRPVFGVSYGRRLRRWIDERYEMHPVRPPGRNPRPRFWAVVAVRNGRAAPVQPAGP